MANKAKSEVDTVIKNIDALNAEVIIYRNLRNGIKNYLDSGREEIKI